MNELILKFDKPVKFEGKEYAEVDFSKIEEFTTEDICQAAKTLTKLGVAATIPEMDYTYNLILAQKATNLPLEFFMGLPGKYASKIKSMIGGYFLAD